jgi:uncharacterized protein YkwD
LGTLLGLALCILPAFGCDQQVATNVLGATVATASESCARPMNEDALRARVIELINAERAAHGLGPLRQNETLNRVANEYACEMIEGEFFAHTNPLTGEGPGERAVRAGYSFVAMGENLAAGQRTAEIAVDDWMNSTTGHRENILHPTWTEIGVAVRLGGVHGVYWVQEFGDPSISSPQQPLQHVSVPGF